MASLSRASDQLKWLRTIFALVSLGIYNIVSTGFLISFYVCLQYPYFAQSGKFFIYDLDISGALKIFWENGILANL
tara:strand:- start:595 stop:822 length:228 start_codon:yes stop_codon:yes gene_type:complete